MAVDNQPHFDPEPVVAAVVAGDVDQFRLIVREYNLLIRGFIAARLYHQEDVEDLAQEVFVTAFKRIDSCDPAHFRNWLIGIAKHHLLNHWRKVSRRTNAMEQFRHEIVNEIEAELDEELQEFNSNQVERLLDCISQLPNRARRIVRAGLDGTRADSLAEELGMNANSIYQARFRAHTALRKCIQQTQPNTET